MSLSLPIGIWSWIWILALPPNSFVTLSEVLNLSESHTLICKNLTIDPHPPRMIVFTCENSTVPSSQLAINTCGLPSFPWLKYLNYDLSPLLAQDIQYREVTWRPNFMSFAVCQNYITYLKSSVCQQANAGFLSRMQSVTTSVIHRKLPLGLKYFLEALGHWALKMRYPSRILLHYLCTCST